MSTKEQHFVPRVYMKAWETTVETSKEPTKKFQGVYIFENSEIGEGANRKTVLWKPHLYTINFRYYFICKSCPRVKSEFVNMIYKLLRTEFKQPVYGKLAHSVIKTKKSINKKGFPWNLGRISCGWSFRKRNKRTSYETRNRRRNRHTF